MKKENKKIIIEKELIYEIIFLILGFCSILFFYKHNIITLMLLGGIWMFALFVWHKKIDFITFVMTAAIGTIVEIISINTGVWAYLNPTILGIPIWIPLAWGYAGVFIRRISVTIGNLIG